jgi:cellobiose phosphorylase
MAQQLTEFVPLNDPLKVCVIGLKNNQKKRRNLSITFYIRPVMGVSDKVTSQYITTQMHTESGLLLIKNVFNSDFKDRTVFMGSSEKLSSYTGDRWEFVGVNGSLEEPDAMRKQSLMGRTGAGVDPCGAIQVKLSINGMIV